MQSFILAALISGSAIAASYYPDHDVYAPYQEQSQQQHTETPSVQILNSQYQKIETGGSIGCFGVNGVNPARLKVIT